MTSAVCLIPALLPEISPAVLAALPGLPGRAPILATQGSERVRGHSLG